MECNCSGRREGVVVKCPRSQVFIKVDTRRSTEKKERTGKKEEVKGFDMSIVSVQNTNFGI